MIVGFTGTRKGMTKSQKTQLARLAAIFFQGGVGELHHGDAIGADTQAVLMFASVSSIKAVAHPAGKNPLSRNRDIVNACDLLIAAPRTNTEEQRSGTWATVRYARRQGKPVLFLSR